MTAALHCPRCGKQLSLSVQGAFVFRCPRCKSQVGGETRTIAASIVTVVTSAEEDQRLDLTPVSKDT